MSPAGRTERGRRTAARLLEAAGTELRTTGRVEVTAVAARAEVSVGLLYRYFGDQGGLVGAVVHAFYDRYDAAVFAVPAPPDVGWFAAERARLEREVAFLYADPLAVRIVSHTPREPAAALADADRLRRHVELAARNIRAGRRRGEVAATVDPPLAAAGFVGALRSVLAAALGRDPRPAPTVVVDTVWAMGAAIILPADRAD